MPLCVKVGKRVLVSLLLPKIKARYHRVLKRRFNETCPITSNKCAPIHIHPLLLQNNKQVTYNCLAIKWFSPMAIKLFSN